MDTRKRLEKVLTTALGQSFEECPNAKKVVIQQTLIKRYYVGGMLPWKIICLTRVLLG